VYPGAGTSLAPDTQREAIMRIKGTTLSKLNELVLVFERNGINPDTDKEVENIVFTLRPVTDYQLFLDLVPEPKPPVKILKGGTREEDRQNPEYLERMNKYYSKEVNYTLICSMQATKGLEWTRVKMDDPETWEFAIEELQEFLYDQEVFKVYQACTTINSVTDASLDKARERFLASQRRKREDKLSSLITEQSSTQSGEPANDSESSPKDATPDGTTPGGDTKPETTS